MLRRFFRVALAVTFFAEVAFSQSPATGPVRVQITPANPLVIGGFVQGFKARLGFFSAAPEQANSSAPTSAIWTSSDESVAVIDPNTGMATPMNNGSTVITARIGPFTGFTTLVVSATDLSSISILPGAASVPKGLSQSFSAQGHFVDGSSQDITQSVIWSSSDPSLVVFRSTLGAQGIAEALAQGGPVTVTATHGSVQATTTMTVTAPVLRYINLSPEEASVPKGLSQQFLANGILTDGTVTDVTATAQWSSTNNTVALVNATGLAMTLAQGASTITAALNGIQGSSHLSVLPPALVSITVSPGGQTLIAGNTLQFAAQGTYTDATAQDLTAVANWSSSDGGIASISPSGLARGLASGTTSISAALNQVIGSTSLAVSQTYANGTRLYIRSVSGNDVSEVGLETTWGSSIVAASLNGVEFVNRDGTGREVQPAFYDGKGPYQCCGIWGWDPVLAGDDLNQGTPTLTSSMTGNSIYTSAQPLQWNPATFGGGLGNPIFGDLIVEQTLTPVPNQPRAFQAHYKVTHLGSDLHTNWPQEFPAVYTNEGYDHFVYYAGTVPWTNGPLTTIHFPNNPDSSPLLLSLETWGALVDAQNGGLTIYVPSALPYTQGFSAPVPGPGGPDGDTTYYFQIATNLTIGPGFVMEADIYLILGDVTAARQVIYALHQQRPRKDVFTGFQGLDQPAPGSTLKGVAQFDGWSFDDVAVSKVELMVDGAVDGMATYGLSRPDVVRDWPTAPVDCGYSYSLNTKRYKNGVHDINVRVTDTSGNIAIFPTIQMTFSN